MSAEAVCCTHPDFAAEVTVNRLTDTGRFMADVRIVCAGCRVPFRFIGLRSGVRHDGPTVSADAAELRVPVAAAPDVLSIIDGAEVSARRSDAIPAPPPPEGKCLMCRKPRSRCCC